MRITSWTASLSLHILVLALLLSQKSPLFIQEDEPVSANTDHALASSLPSEEPALHEETPWLLAGVVDAEDIDAAVADIQAQEAQKAAEERERLEKFESALWQAQRQREEEELKLLLTRQETQDIQQQYEESKRALMALEQSQDAVRHASEGALETMRAELDALRAQKQQIEQEKRKVQKEAKEAKAQRDAFLSEQSRLAQLAQEQKESYTRQEIHKYVRLIRQKVGQNWSQPRKGASDLACVMTIRTLPSGEVTECLVTQSSGDLTFDRAAELSVLKSSPLPMPYDQDLAEKFRMFKFTFKLPEGTS